MPRTQSTPRDNKAARSFQFKIVTAVPTVRYGPGATVCVVNSTGSAFAINTTGTTWRYTSMTAVLA
jgi:hypothetical protein